MLHGPEYRTHVSVGLFEGRHQTVTSETEMDNPSSRECFMRWIFGQIAIEGETASWVANAEVQITKASLLFPSKVWWAFFRAQLLATANDNTLSPSFASLVACLIVVYPLNVVRIIATIMRDKTLNEREGGFAGRPIILESKVVEADIQAFPEIHSLFKSHQFEWMNNMLVVSVQGQSIDISETRVNRMLHGPEYRTHVSVGLFEVRHQTVTSETEMDDPSSREFVMRWIFGQIAIEGETASWVANAEVQITKASLLFPSKVWWAFFRAQLLATANDNTLSPSFASLVACLIVVYLLNVVRIIATKMRDKTLNEREGRHQTVTSETEMDDPSSRECFMRWIFGQIAIEGETASWVANAEVQITKASLLFPSKVWWVVFRAQLLATANDNTLSPSLASLVACLIVGYPLNVVRIIATKM
uniref:Putative plant transposon protein domain-containing protein n=1 Tax=Solanum tuberosum TaxID=4113 RepID=M1DY22_SOLTU